MQSKPPTRPRPRLTRFPVNPARLSINYANPSRDLSQTRTPSGFHAPRPPVTTAGHPQQTHRGGRDVEPLYVCDREPGFSEDEARRCSLCLQGLFLVFHQQAPSRISHLDFRRRSSHLSGCALLRGGGRQSDDPTPVFHLVALVKLGVVRAMGLPHLPEDLEPTLSQTAKRGTRSERDTRIAEEGINSEGEYLRQERGRGPGNDRTPPGGGF